MSNALSVLCKPRTSMLEGLPKAESSKALVDYAQTFLIFFMIQRYSIINLPEHLLSMYRIKIMEPN